MDPAWSFLLAEFGKRISFRSEGQLRAAILDIGHLRSRKEEQ